MAFDSIGKNIKKYRLERKMRQEDLAERSGLSTNYVGMVERGEKLPALETFITILNVLGVSADMVLIDVLDVGYTIKDSMLGEKIASLSREEREKIYAVINTLLKYT